MSLGWQTESALLPSKSKQINNVDGKSLIELKALIYAKEENKRSGENTKVSRKRRGIDEFQQSSNSVKTSSVKISKRGAKDDDPDDKEARAFQALNAKSKLYSEIMAGTSVGGEGALIDFRNKPNVREVQEEFTPTSSSSSTTHSMLPPPIAPSSSSSQWAWSKGQDNDDADVPAFVAARRQERQLANQIEEKITQESNVAIKQQGQGPSESSSSSSSSSARVKTQWEKTLNSSARGYLEDVHLATLATMQAKDKDKDNTTKKLSVKEDRRAMLRQKQEHKRQAHLQQQSTNIPVEPTIPPPPPPSSPSPPPPSSPSPPLPSSPSSPLSKASQPLF